MGKKQKGGRRQILQLEDKKPPRSSSKNRIKNVIHYSDSDEDSKKSNDSEHSSGAGNKDNCPLDSEVAVFFKEIDALTVNEESTDTNENSVTVENQSMKENTVNSFESQNSSIQSDEKLLEGTIESGVKAYCPWQEITDDSTGYSYYWNVETNDVTWDCPEEYAAYITAMNSDSQVTRNEEMESLKELQRKKESQLVEGAIIPITYFGDSSSSEESEDSDNNCNTLSNRRKEKSSKIKSCKVGLAKAEYDEIDAPLYGPVLPPELRIPDEVVPAEKNLELSSNLKNAECDIESRIVDQSKMSLQNETLSEYKENSETLHNTCDITSSQSVVNIPFIGPSISNHCEDFERTYNKGEENPEPTMKPKAMLTSTGLALVEYSSFSEDEEEMESSSLSPMKHNVASNVSVPSPAAQFCNEEKSAENKELEATKSVTEMVDISFNKRKNDELSEELLDSSVIKKVKKSKPSNVLDIDGMFASHLSNQKHGFGFVKHHTEFNDSDSSCSDHNQDYRTNSKNDYKSVSFVKSKYVLDLNELNGTISPKEFGPTLLKDDTMLKNQSSQNSLDKNIENDLRDKENYMKKNVVNVKEDDVDSTVTKDLNVGKIMDCEVSAGIHSKIITTEEEDIEEIDKILCEAFKKKRLENSSRNASLSTLKRNAIMSANVDSLIMKPQLKDVKNNSTRVEVHEKGESNENKTTQEKNKDSILDLSSLLVDKLTFLISNHSPLSSLSVLLAQLQTRLTDWQAAALETKYFVARLQEVNQYVCQYEMGIVSGDWICHWDRENKSYYYVNTKTQHSQWTYPDDQSVDTKESWIQSKTEIPTSSASLLNSEQDEHQIVSSSSPEDSTKNNLKSCKSDTENQSIASSKKSCRSSPPPLPPGVDSPPPPCNPPSHSPLPPSDKTEVVCDLTEDMDLENSNDSCSQIIISNSNIYETNQIHCSSMLVCSSSSSIKNFSESGFNVISSLQTTKENPNIISRSHQTSVFNDANDSKTCILWSAPIPSCSSEVVKYSEAQTSAVTSTSSIVTSQTSDSVFDPCLSSSSVKYLSITDDVPNKANTSSGTALKKEKRKMKLQSVLALKKKNIPSLVEKWQKIKEEQAKEDIS